MNEDIEIKMSEPRLKSKKTTWTRAILTFLAPLILVFVFRWALYEPYVIPSGSMIPTLLIHDHIFVSKWVYGLRLPFTERWLFNWKKPQPGEVVVFRYPKDRETFFVKRIVATEGDTIEVQAGQLLRNGEPVARTPMDSLVIPDELNSEFDYFKEQLGTHNFISRSYHLKEDRRNGEKFTVPAGHFFVVGDNRDESHDSRAWGFVPINYLIGRAGIIWLSCNSTLPAAPFLCDPTTFRWRRLFSSVE